MDNNERKLVIVLLCIAFSMMISGCFFVPFVIHIWTYLANLAGEKDVFLASILVSYFIMFAFVGAAVGLWLNAYGARLCHVLTGYGCKLLALVKSTKKK